MIVNDKFEFIFVHVPKTAGKSIVEALKPLKGNNKWLIDRKTKHETLYEFSASYANKRGFKFRNWRRIFNAPTDEIIKMYFCFGFVRNPWDRMLSLYNYLQKMRPRDEISEIKSFEHFVLESCNEASWINTLHSMRLQADYFKPNNDCIDMDYIGHYESLHEDLKIIGLRLGIDIEIPHVNKSRDSEIDYRKFYEASMVDIVIERFSEDIKTFDYCFEKKIPGSHFKKNHRVDGSL